MTHICIMSILFFFYKSIRIYMEVIILGTNTLYSVFCFFKTLLPKQVYFGLIGRLDVYHLYMAPYLILVMLCSCSVWICHVYHFIHFLISSGVPCLLWYFLHFIRESVDSLCRDGAGTPIVRVHRKAR